MSTELNLNLRAGRAQTAGVSRHSRRPAYVAARLAWSVAAVVLAGIAAAQWSVGGGERARIAALLETTGLAERAPDTAASVRREPDPYWARIAVVRALTGEAVDPVAFSRLPPRKAMEQAAAVGARLELARDLARQAAAARPAVWQAPMLEGTAVYLAWSRRGAPELFTHREAWRSPLDRALALAPGKAEPRRVLAAATLETWNALTPGERRAAVPSLEAAFGDPATFSRLAQLWLQRAPSLEEAFGLVPHTVAAWALVERLLSRQGVWPAVAEARIRRRTVLERQLEADVRQLRQRVRGGDVVGARRQLLEITEGTPPDRRYATAVAAAWQVAPAMALDPTRRAALHAWLSWATKGAVRGRELLPPRVVDRLASAVGDLEPPERALALIAAGRLAEAEALARRAEDLNTDRWSDYCIAAARALAGRGEADEANRLLSFLPAVRRSQLPAAAAIDGDGRGSDSLRGLSAREWPATMWRWSGARATLDLLPAAPGDVELSFDVAPALGAVVEVSIDFEVTWIGVVGPNETVRLAMTGGGAEPRCLAVEAVAGGRVMPGAVRLSAPGGVKGEGVGARVGSEV